MINYITLFLFGKTSMNVLFYLVESRLRGKFESPVIQLA